LSIQEKERAMADKPYREMTLLELLMERIRLRDLMKKASGKEYVDLAHQVYQTEWEEARKLEC
jgi:hypothetical protein